MNEARKEVEEKADEIAEKKVEVDHLGSTLAKTFRQANGHLLQQIHDLKTRRDDASSVRDHLQASYDQAVITNNNMAEILERSRRMNALLVNKGADISPSSQFALKKHCASMPRSVRKPLAFWSFSRLLDLAPLSLFFPRRSISIHICICGVLAMYSCWHA